MIETDFARTDLWFMLRGASMTLALTFWAVLGGTASVVASWSTPAGTRSLGVVGYKQSAAGPLIGLTQVFVDASGVPAIAQAPVLRDKQRR